MKLLRRLRGHIRDLSMDRSHQHSTIDLTQPAIAIQAFDEPLLGARLTRAETLMLEEYQQAWDHSRHLETIRGQYLGFFFTVALGSAAVAIPIVGAALNNRVRLLMFSGFLTVFFLLTSLIYISVVKFGLILGQYQRGIHLIRDYLYAESNTPEDLIQWMRFRELRNPLVTSRLFSVQTAAERILRLFLFLTTFATSLVGLRLRTLQAPWWQIALVGFLVAVTLLAASALTVVPRGRRP